MPRTKGKTHTKRSTVSAISRSDERKKQLALKRQRQQSLQKFVSTAVSSILLSSILSIFISIIVGIKPAILIGLGIPIFLLSFRYPRQALWAFLIYLPFSGTIVYSAIGQGNALFQLAKDIFYVPALLGLVYECNRKRKPILIPKKLLFSLGILLFFSLLTLFLVNGMKEFLPTCDSLRGAERFLRDANGEWIINPNTGEAISTPCKGGKVFLQGILGFKILLGYVPLIFCAHYLIEDKKKLFFLGRLLLTLAIICCTLALVQFWMLKTGRCQSTEGLGVSGIDLFKPNLDAKCFVGGSLLYSPSQGVIRLPGTFVSPWHWAWFLVANAAITYTVAFSETSRFWQIAGLTGMALVFINAVICGQRLAFGLVPAMFFALAVLTGQIVNFKRFIPLGLGLGILLFLSLSFINPDFIQERIDSFVSRWNSSPPQEFILQQFNFVTANQRGILGFGLGKATNATRAFAPVSLIETFHPKIVFEMGIIGLIAFMAFLTNLLILAFKDYRSLKDRSLRNYGASFWVFLLIISYLPYWYPLDTDPVAVYYWLFAGVIFKLPEIEKQEQKAAALEHGGQIPKNKKLVTTRAI